MTKSVLLSTMLADLGWQGERVILHLCADTGSDTWPYRGDPRYLVVTVGADIGVENLIVDAPVWGIVANPVCTEFSQAKKGKAFGGVDHASPSDPEAGLWLVRECERVIFAADPQWWVIENPATGTLRDYLGEPAATYEPWHFGSPWTKRTALWGKFTMPPRRFERFDDVPLNPDIYVRPGRRPSMAWLHKSAFESIPEFRDSGMPAPTTDAEMRSLCSQKFAAAFKVANP